MGNSRYRYEILKQNSRKRKKKKKIQKKIVSNDEHGDLFPVNFQNWICNASIGEAWKKNVGGRQKAKVNSLR
jgi:hypothetical protein